jgi:MFS family permease
MAAHPLSRVRIDRTFLLLFTVMLAIAAGNTAMQSIMPALGRSLKVADSLMALVFSMSALLWMIAAPFWANRSDRHGRRAMVLVGVAGFTVSNLVCGLFLAAGINGWLAPLTTILAFICGRLLYGGFGAAAPPAVQALVAGRTTREERTRALTLLASAFGLGTILGPAIAPYLVLDRPLGFGPHIGLAGPAFVFCLFGALIWIAVARWLPREEVASHGAMASYPSIGGQGSGANVTAATAEGSERVKLFDPRIRAWMIVGLVFGHAQAMAGQTMGFLVIDRLHVASTEALQSTGLVLMMGAGSSLLAQWGVIPLLDLSPRKLVIAGLALAAAGCLGIAAATSLYGIAMGYAVASLGFGFCRPGFTAGSSLAVGPAAQGSVAGKVTSINGAVFVLGPSIGVGLYEFWHPLPYLTAATGLAAAVVYAMVSLRPSAPGRGASPAQ